MSSARAALIEEEHEQGVHSDRSDRILFQKDTKYSWFVCACAFFDQVFVLGVLHAFGVFFVEIVKEFGSSKGATAWVGSLAYGLSMTFSPITSQLLARYSYRRVMMAGGVFCVFSLVLSSFMGSVTVLYITFSIFYGIGTCMATAPTMTITPEYFDRHMSIATGITVSGSSFGTLIMGPLAQFIIDQSGWRTAFRVFAGFIVITIILNSRIRTPPGMKRRKHESRSFINDLQIWRNRVFLVWTAALTLVMFGFYIPYVHLVSYAIDQGIEPNMASLLMMVLGATTASGRIMFGKIVQHGSMNRLYMHQMSMLITGLGVMILPLIKSYVGIVLYVITVGLVDGCFVVLLPIITASLMGIDKSVVAWGFLTGTCSITFTLGPPVAGALYDSTGTYNVAFHCAGVPIITGAAVLFLMPWAKRHAKPEDIVTFATEEITIKIEKSESSDAAEGPEAVVRSISIESVSVAVQTIGPSSLKSVDKSTLTDDASLRHISLDVADVLSQLSYNSQVFDEMLQKSLSLHSEMLSSPQETQGSCRNIPVPSNPEYFRQWLDGLRSQATSVQSFAGSVYDPQSQTSDQQSVHSDSVKSGYSTSLARNVLDKNRLQSRQSTTVPESENPIGPENHDRSSFSFQSPLGQTHVYSDPSSPHSGGLTSSSKHSNISCPASNQPFSLPNSAAVTQHTRDTEILRVLSAKEGFRSKQQRSFDQTISDEVKALSQDLKSATPSRSSLANESNSVKSSHPTSPFQSSSSVSESIDIKSPKSLQQDFALEHSNPYQAMQARPSVSEIIRDAAIVSVEERPGPSVRRVEDPSVTRLGSTNFARENELTVVPATNPFATKVCKSGTKLEDLFKPTRASSSSELAKTASDTEVQHNKESEVDNIQNNTEELDVFTHLFEDDLNTGDKPH